MTASISQKSGGLNPAQIHLLNLFSKKMSEQEILDLKILLVEFYDQKAQAILDKIWNERGMTQADLDKILATQSQKSKND
jgi:uncharacterized iron-regulated protein